MYLDSFDILVKNLFFYRYSNYSFYPNLSINCFIGRIVYVDSSSFLVDFGGDYYLKYTISDLEYQMFLTGFFPVSLLGNSVIVLFSVGEENTFFFSPYSRNYFLRKRSFNVFLRNVYLFPNVFSICNLVVLKWFRYRKRIWAGMSGLKILIK